MIVKLDKNKSDDSQKSQHFSLDHGIESGGLAQAPDLPQTS